MPAAATPEGSLLDEILEDRAVSSRGQVKPPGVKRKMSNYPLRAPGPLSRKGHRWAPEFQPVLLLRQHLALEAVSEREDAPGIPDVGEADGAGVRLGPRMVEPEIR